MFIDSVVSCWMNTSLGRPVVSFPEGPDGGQFLRLLQLQGQTALLGAVKA